MQETFQEHVYFINTKGNKLYINFARNIIEISVKYIFTNKNEYINTDHKNKRTIHFHEYYHKNLLLQNIKPIVGRY